MKHGHRSVGRDGDGQAVGGQGGRGEPGIGGHLAVGAGEAADAVPPLTFGVGRAQPAHIGPVDLVDEPEPHAELRLEARAVLANGRGLGHR